MTKDFLFETGSAYMIRWTDNCGTPAGWISLEEEDYSPEVPHITSYGTIINKSDDTIVLAQSYCGGSDNIKKQAMGIIVISIACISEAHKITSSCLEASKGRKL